jgi:hypothetical protein
MELSIQLRVPTALLAGKVSRIWRKEKPLVGNRTPILRLSRQQHTHHSGQAIRKRKFPKRLPSSPQAELSEIKKAFETSALAAQ